MPNTMTMEQWRLISKISKVQMAKKLDVHPVTYDKYEANPALIPLGKAFEFCNIVGQSFDTVFLHQDTKQNVE